MTTTRDTIVALAGAGAGFALGAVAGYFIGSLATMVQAQKATQRQQAMDGLQSRYGGD